MLEFCEAARQAEITHISDSVHWAEPEPVVAGGEEGPQQDQDQASNTEILNIQNKVAQTSQVGK